MLLDTHAWVWWVKEDRRLSRRAKTAISTALAEHDLWLSLISVWEVAKKLKSNSLFSIVRLISGSTRPSRFRRWASGSSRVRFSILVHSCDLPNPFHGDPADQIIVATARHHGAVVVSKDQRIREYAHVQSLW
jgi:PIN domain nuclease of toxin-antitoxin system